MTPPSHPSLHEALPIKSHCAAIGDSAAAWRPCATAPRGRSRNPDRKRAAMEACLAARAFAAGFCRGADPERACRRHVIGAHHEHWLRGYHAGLRAAEHATQRYLRDQLQPSSTPPDASATATAAIGANRASSTPSPPRARATRTTRAPLPPQLTCSEVTTRQAHSLSSRSVATAPAAAARGSRTSWSPDRSHPRCTAVAWLRIRMATSAPRASRPSRYRSRPDAPRSPQRSSTGAEDLPRDVARA